MAAERLGAAILGDIMKKGFLGRGAGGDIPS
jgi:hypothetical protein